MTSPSRVSALWLLFLLTGLAVGPITLTAQDEPQNELERLAASGDPQSFVDFTRELPEGAVNIARVLDPLQETWWEIDVAVAEKFNWDQDTQSAEFRDAWESVRAQRQQVFEAVDEVVDEEHWLPRLNYDARTANEFTESQGEDLQYLRSLARVHQYAAIARLESGDAQGAARIALNQLKLARTYPRWNMTGFLAGNVMQQIALSSLGRVLETPVTLSTATHEAIEEELARHDSLQRLTECYRNERVFGLQSLRDQGVPGIFQVENYLKRMRQAIEESSKTIGQQPELLPEGGAISAAMVDPGLSMVRESAHRGLAMVRCLRVANQLRSAMISEPDIESIALPETTRTDPYTDQPLTLRETEEGFVIYSFGRNRLNDNGQFLNNRDIGLRLRPGMD